MSAPLAPPPRPPLPGDLRRRLDILLAKAALRRFPKLREAITALVLDAWCRQPGRTALIRDDAIAELPPVPGSMVPGWAQEPWTGKRP